jgi:hypothetical protein
MAQELGVVLAMAAVVLVIATCVAPVKPANDSVAAMPASEAIYRPQHLNVTTQCLEQERSTNDVWH